MTTQMKRYISFFLRIGKPHTLLPEAILAFAVLSFIGALIICGTLLRTPQPPVIEGIWLLLIFAALAIAQSTFLAKALNDYFNEEYVTHLTFYRVTKRDLRVLSSLFIVLPNLITAWIVFLFASMSTLFEYAPLFTVLFFIICEIVPSSLTLRVAKARRFKNGSTALGSKLLLKKQTAYLFRDIKLARNIPFFISMILLTLISLVFAAFVFMELAASVFLSFSYVLVLFLLLSSLFEIEYNETANYHRRWYRISNKTLVSLKNRVVLIAAGFLFFVHLVLIICLSAHSVEMIILDFIFLLLALFILYCTSWSFILLQNKSIRLNVIVVTILMLMTIIFPAGIVVGLISRARLKER